MELQGSKPAATHDFLSFYSRDRPSPPCRMGPSQGFLLKTQDFLRPLERKTGDGGRERPLDINEPAASPERPLEHVLPGGIGTYSIRRAPLSRPSLPFGAAVKSEGGAGEVEARVTTVAAHPASTSASGRGFTLWEENLHGLKASEELAVRVGTDAKNNSEQKPSTPRSKHSATEQRRRSKINDRFQILRGLIPHSDQKRDKASFLLEVIEYIQFLQEKVQKYESEFPGWQETPNVMPWQRNPQQPVDDLPDPCCNVENGQAPTNFISSAHVAIPNVPVMLPNSRAQPEPDIVNSGVSGKATGVTIPVQQAGVATGITLPQKRTTSESDNMAFPLQAQYLRSDMSLGQIFDQDLTIDDGTINISSSYSQGVMNALEQSLRSSGVDMSQATVSVQISLGRRPSDKPSALAECEAPSARSGSSEDESGKANKRRKVVRS